MFRGEVPGTGFCRGQLRHGGTFAGRNLSFRCKCNPHLPGGLGAAYGYAAAYGRNATDEKTALQSMAERLKSQLDAINTRLDVINRKDETNMSE